MKFLKWKKLLLLLVVCMVTTAIVVPMTVREVEGALSMTAWGFIEDELRIEEDVTYEEETDSVTITGGSVALGRDYRNTRKYLVSKPIIIDGDFTLYGYGLLAWESETIAKKYKDQPMFTVKEGAKFTINGHTDVAAGLMPLELNRESADNDPQVWGILIKCYNYEREAPAIRCEGSLVMTNVTMSGCKNISTKDTASGGAIATGSSGSSNLTLTSCAFYRCHSQKAGSAIALMNVTGTAKISKCIFVENTAVANRGTIRAFQSCQMAVTVDQCVFRDNHATASNGAGISWLAVGAGSPSLTISNCQFVQNETSDSGGALEIVGKNVTIKSSSSNMTKPLHDTKVTPDKIVGTLFYENQAAIHGGAIYVSTYPIIVEGPLHFTSNTATASGGGIYLSDSTLTLKNPTFSGNTASSNDGGGGGIRLSNSTLTLENPTFSGNTATSNGGAIYSPSASTINITNGTISENTAEDGAGIYAIGNSSLTMSGTTVTGNIASSDSGGIRLTNATAKFTNVSITNNSSTQYGGGLYAYGNATITMIGGSVSGNTTVKGGGGIALSCNTSGNSPTMSITDTVIQNNTVTDGSGGGLRLSTATATLTNVTFSGNRATDTDANGGAISAVRTSSDDGPSILTISGGSFTGNQAGNAGGVIHCNNSTLDISGASVTSNNAKNGGGLYVSNGSTFTMDQCTLSKNTASSNGGGLYLNAVTLNLTNGTFSQNTASSNGGGIYVESATLNMSGGTISDSPSSNTDYTARNGGGVYVLDSGSFDFTGGTIDKCYTSDGGGGVRVVGKSTMTMSGTAKITNCMAVKNGGGIYVWGPNADVSEDTVMNKNDTSVLTIDGGTISSCWVKEGNGGGIYVNGGAYCELDGGTISNNTAIKSGGGVSVRYGYFYMYDGIITSNEVTGTNSEYCGGGGIGVFGDRNEQIMNVYIHGGTISDNKSSLNGGGIAAQVTATGTKINVYVGCSACYGAHSGEKLSCANDTSEIIHICPKITGNSAINGGGFYLHADESKNSSAELSLYCGSADDNTSQNSSSYNAYQTGGDIHLYAFNIGKDANPGITLIGGNFTQYNPNNWANAIDQITLYYFMIWNDSDPKETAGSSYYTSKVSKGVSLNMPAYTDAIKGETVAWELGSPNTNSYIYVGDVITISDSATDTYYYAIYKGAGRGNPVTPTIQAGSIVSFAPSGSEATLSANSAFTVLFDVTSMEPSYYRQLALRFQGQGNEGPYSLPKAGTTVIMVVQIDQAGGIASGTTKEYYYYTFPTDYTAGTSINLTNFKKLGTGAAYARPTGYSDGAKYSESILFIVDFANEITKNATGNIILDRSADTQIGDNVRQTAKYTLCPNRSFTVTSSNVTEVDDSFTVTYETTSSAVEDTTYDGHYAVLVLKPANGYAFPLDTILTANESAYSLTSDGKFIVPIRQIVATTSATQALPLQLASKNASAIQAVAEIWMADANGKLIGTACIQSTTLSLAAKTQPALSISMDERIFHLSSLPASKAVTVTDEATAKGYTVSWAVVTKSGAATSMTVSNGALTFGSNPQVGTYRIVATVKSGNTEVMTVPYTFIILE
ncbi:MAG: hypothetical protein IKA05_09240 [Clostridia bacterium]|nr:hypothetical protein [Clostridia bacterium]